MFDSALFGAAFFLCEKSREVINHNFAAYYFIGVSHVLRFAQCEKIVKAVAADVPALENRDVRRV